MLRDALLSRFPELAQLPDDALDHALVVGGAIRDLLLGAEPLDVDLTCDDPLACAERIGRKVIRLGKEELSAYRVVASGRIYDFAETSDLGRRDFTINSMALSLRSGELIDLYGGEADLRAGIVRMIAAKNFDDDPLRMLKAVRMAVKLGFTIDAATAEAIRPRAVAILEVAAERVTTEMVAIFSARQLRTSLRLLQELSLDVPLLGNVDGTFASDDVGAVGAFALLIADPRRYAERWRWSEALLRDVLALQRLIKQLAAGADARVAVYDAGASVAREAPGALRALGREDLASLVDSVVTEELFATTALLTGEEIASLAGIAPGPEVGRLKRKLLEAQIRGEVRTREEAVRYLLSS